MGVIIDDPPCDLTDFYTRGIDSIFLTMFAQKAWAGFSTPKPTVLTT